MGMPPGRQARARLQRPAQRENAEQAVEEGFQRLYEENLSLIYRYVYAWVRNREEAEDLTSEIFLKAVQGVDYRRNSREIQNWLYRVARTTLADHWRHRYRQHTFSLEQYLREEDEEPVDDEPSFYSGRRAKKKDPLSEYLSTDPLERLFDEGGEEPVDDELAAGRSENADDVERLLEALPDHYREVLTCRFLLDLSIKDTAHRMGLTEANVKVMQLRALKQAAKLAHVLTD
jgi:RNA polymerase sigma-70 factor (ECF subfamily)